MSKVLKKAIFLQNIPYTLPENRLAEYHGAIFAEELQKKGVSVTKMVLGDPETQKPISELLSISSLEQRLSPDFWKAQQCDLIVFYGGMNMHNIPVMKAIKSGNPDTILILKMDASYGPFTGTGRGIFECIKTMYIKTRNGHWSKGRDGAIPASRPIALSLAISHGLRLLSRKYVDQVTELFDVPDYISYENISALEQAQYFFRHHSKPTVAKKVIWLGYPARNSLAETKANATRDPGSVISIANWKHAKDIQLHAKATDLVLRNNPISHFMIIGANSKKLRDQILRLNPEAAHRVTQMDEISNLKIHDFLQQAEIFMLCSSSEGICSAVIEALCTGCSAALSCGLGVPCFKEFVDEDCGTQATSRKPIDMAKAVLMELELWEQGKREPKKIQEVWSKTLVSNLCKHLCATTGLIYPSNI